MTQTVDHEFGFELRVCAWADRAWPPDTDGSRPAIVARQLGTRERRWDTVVIEVNPHELDDRSAFGPDGLDGDLLHVLRHAPAAWTYYRDALPDPGYPWRYVREAIHRASDRGVLEERKRGNRIEIRRIAPYPEWVSRIVAIENKPDLDASAARALRDQLERDVAFGLADEVWVATRATGRSIEPALLEDMPVEAGILAVALDDDTAPSSVEVLWHPRSLAVSEPGTRIEERADSSTYGERAARFEYEDPDTKAKKRLTIAERAYERGWRSYLDTMRPDCRHFDVERVGHAYLPDCRAKGREPTAGECQQACASFEPEPPRWRQGSWPIDGGPGKTIKDVLGDRRSRRR
ncbi:MAG: DUF5787 family protein [Halanaeroarchaeum sp.]